MDLISTTQAAPLARTTDLVISTVGDEMMVYDRGTDHIHHLNAPCVQVWRLCDGAHSLNDLSQRTNMSRDVVSDALTRLGEAGLLEHGWETMLSEHSRATRRQLVGRAALAGGVAVPVIVSITAPASSGIGASPAITCATDQDIVATCDEEWDDLGPPLHLPHPIDCSMFCQCANPAPQDMPCSSGLHFNPATQECDFPSNFPPPCGTLAG